MDNRVGDLAKGRSSVKKEIPDEDIKEYAETAMNELLGWYGYGSVPRDEMKTSANCNNSNSNSNSSGPPSPSHSNDGCGWCGKPVEDKTGIASGNLKFCSELCFSQSRRANFKKNKTCDWCRHVRHTVSYVDFQDGASQLQFCSDKCLNQYKMHLFCRETWAHLDMHPHLPSEDAENGLITPELWLKNCKSPERTTTTMSTPSPTISPKPREPLPQTSPLPLITVAHPSKLLAAPEEINNKRKRTPVQRKRKRPPPLTPIANSMKNNDLPQDLRIRQSPPAFGVFEKQINSNFNDIRVPPQQQPQQQLPQQQPPKPSNRNNNNNNNFNSFPKPSENPLKPSENPLKPSENAPNPSSVLPPVTILVPYPILVPVPLPIPIPLPMRSFLEADKLRTVKPADSEMIPESVTSSHTRNRSNEPGEVMDCGAVKENGTGPEPERNPDAPEPSTNGISRPLRKRKRAPVVVEGTKAKGPKKIST